MSEELKVAIEAAKAGAKEALKYFKEDVEVELKEDNTPVTIADKESEKVIKSIILSKYPNSNFIAEESGGERNVTTYWTIDPVDGTRSFSRGIPLWCVLIAYCENDEIQVGVCYFPVIDVMLSAQRGNGAFYNGKQVKVSKISELSKAYVGYGNPRYIDNKSALLNLLDKSGSARSPEATYADYFVACGKMDVFVDGYAHIWDSAPFKVIIEEAGGKITNFQGKPWNKYDRGIIATNGLLHDVVVDILNNQ